MYLKLQYSSPQIIPDKQQIKKSLLIIPYTNLTSSDSDAPQNIETPISRKRVGGVGRFVRIGTFRIAQEPKHG